MTRKARHEIQQKSFKSLMLQANLMREESFLTDVKLICEDKEFLVHKVILSAASPYFKEYFKRNSQTTSLQIDFMDSKTLDTVLVFIYEGRIDLRNQSQKFLKDLLEAFIRLRISLICSYCLELLLGTEQLLPQWNTVEQLNSYLIQQIYLDCLYTNIKTLKTTEDFLNLTFEQVNSIFSNSPFVNPVNQEEVIDALLSWIKYDELARSHSITDLLATVDFTKISISMLIELTNEALLKDNFFFYKQCTTLFSQELIKRDPTIIRSSVIPACNKAETEADNSYKERKSPEEKKTAVIPVSEDSEEDPKRICKEIETPHKSEDRKLTSLKDSSKSCIQKTSLVTKTILAYNSRKWKGMMEYSSDTEALKEMKDETLLYSFSKAEGSAVCCSDNCIYFFGGRDKDGTAVTHCYILDMADNRFTKIDPMKEKRFNAAAVRVDHFMYVIRGESNGKCLDSYERYNLKTQSWDPVQRMPFKDFKNNIPVLAVDERLCLIGKTNLHWHDPRTEEWTEGQPLPYRCQKQLQTSASYGDGKIFLVLDGLCNVYCLDLMKKSWSTFSPSPETPNCMKYIFCIQKPDEMEFLVLCSKKLFIFRPPKYWKYISTVPYKSPAFILI